MIPKSSNCHSIGDDKTAISLIDLSSNRRSKKILYNTLSLSHKGNSSTLTPTNLSRSSGCKTNLMKKKSEVSASVSDSDVTRRTCSNFKQDASGKNYPILNNISSRTLKYQRPSTRTAKKVTWKMTEITNVEAEAVL